MIFWNIMFLSCISDLRSQELLLNPDSIQRKLNLPNNIQNRLQSVLDKNQPVSSLYSTIDTLCRENPDIAFILVQNLKNSLEKRKYSEDWAKLQFYESWLSLENLSENEELELLFVKVEECEAYFTAKKNHLWQSKSLSLLSNIAYNIGYNNSDTLYSKALSFNNRALKALKNQRVYKDDAYTTLGEINRIKGNIYFKSLVHSSDSAMFYYDQSLSNFEIINDNYGQADVNLNKAILLAESELSDRQLKSNEDPTFYFQKAINTYQQTNDLQKARLAYSIYLQEKYRVTRDAHWTTKSSNELEKILKNPHGKKAEAQLQLAMNTQSYLSYNSTNLPDSKQIELLDSIIQSYRLTFISCRLENNLKIYNELFDRLSKLCPYLPKSKCSELLRIANNTKTHFIRINKEINTSITKRNKLFSAAIEFEKRKNLILKVIIFFTLILAFFIFIYARQKINNLKATSAIKQEALRAQMNPHFISNSINAIDSLVNQGRNEEASEYLIDFSRLCRLVIDYSKNASIPLKDEIDVLKYFLSLEKLRLADDLEYSISIDKQINADEILVPSLILQPFVENAIWHGIKNKTEPKRGELKIEVIKLSESLIECIIEDNGVGRKKAKEIQANSIMDQKSWGMALTEERIINAAKGQKGMLKIEDLYDLNDNPKGTRVTIQLVISRQN